MDLEIPDGEHALSSRKYYICAVLYSFLLDYGQYGQYGLYGKTVGNNNFDRNLEMRKITFK